MRRALSAAPLAALVVGMTGDEAARFLGVSRNTVLRWRAGGAVSVMDADRIAAHVGRHPCELWPVEWWELPDAPRMLEPCHR